MTCIKTCTRPADALRDAVYCCSGTVPALGQIRVVKINHRSGAKQRGQHNFVKNLCSLVYVLCFAMLWKGQGFAVKEALHFCLLQLNNNLLIRRSDLWLWSTHRPTNRHHLVCEHFVFWSGQVVIVAVLNQRRSWSCTSMLSETID